MGLTIYGPLLDLRWVNLQGGRDRRVWKIPSDVVERERGKDEKAEFALELRAIELCRQSQCACCQHNSHIERGKRLAMSFKEGGIAVEPCPEFG